jgi:hypothetical protein
MNTNYCQAIQREIDEANLNGELSASAQEHLGRCDKCRRFHHEHRMLRGLMAELETVGAPPDFDFRLRARLARENPSNGFRGHLLTARPLAAIAAVLVLVIAGVVVRNQLSSRNQTATGETASNIGSPSPAPNKVAGDKEAGHERDKAPEKPSLANDLPVDRPVVKSLPPHGSKAGELRNTRSSNSGGVANQRPGVKEYALDGAPVTTLDARTGMVEVPIDTSVFRLSIDNGRGVARTISLPPVSFGSQRLLPRDAAYVPVSSKGDW